jgi:hypothetical protein
MHMPCDPSGVPQRSSRALALFEPVDRSTLLFVVLELREVGDEMPTRALWVTFVPDKW